MRRPHFHSWSRWGSPAFVKHAVSPSIPNRSRDRLQAQYRADGFAVLLKLVTATSPLASSRPTGIELPVPVEDTLNIVVALCGCGKRCNGGQGGRTIRP